MSRQCRARSRIVLSLLFLCVLIAFGGCGSQNPITPEQTLNSIDSFMKEKGGLKQQEDITCASWYRPGDSLTDWAVMTENRMGKELDREKYLEDLKEYVEKAYNTPEKLDRVKATEWQRIAMGVIAAGGDASNFGTAPDGTTIDLIRDGVYGWKQTKELDTQGSNALIYGLHVLEISGVIVPEDMPYHREALLQKLLGYRQADGGFSLGGSGSDVDITAMALQALAHFRESDQKYSVDGREVSIQDVIDDAISYLSGSQHQGGYFVAGSAYSSESCAQVIIALCAVGVDPRKAEEFSKGGANVVDALMTFRNSDGGFASVLNQSGTPEDSDMLATSQAAQAMAALLLLDTNRGSYYDFGEADNK